MKKILIILLLIPSLLFSQKKEKPIINKPKQDTINRNGWRDLLWGMTPEEVKAKINDPYYIETKLFDANFRVKLDYDNRSLIKVCLSHQPTQYKKMSKAEQIVELKRLKSELQTSLTSKYGTPNIIAENCSWNFAKLKIELELHIDPDINFSFFDVIYLTYSKPITDGL